MGQRFCEFPTAVKELVKHYLKGNPNDKYEEYISGDKRNSQITLEFFILIKNFS